LFVNDLVTKLTEFEKLTVLAFRYFADEDVDIAIIETGLGGRLDATNALNPAHSLATAITNIGYDHMDYLGNTLKDIRREKEGIKKPTVPHFELTERNQGVNPNSIAGDNCKLAVKIFESINKITLSDDYLHETCKNFHAYMPCRLQYDLRSHTLWDAAHNVDGFRLLHTHVKELKFRGKFNRLIIVCGFLDKNYQQMLEVFLSDLYKPVSDYIIVSGIDSKRVTDPHKIKEHLHKTYPETKKNHRVFALKSADKAFEKAKSLKQDHDLIIFCGSNYLLGELKTYERSLKKLKSAKV
jgi:dihydrofolate synthase/folylpolyglutamate synthase